MAAAHYVWADVWSDESSERIPFYIHHRSMAAPHYVWADVWPDDPSHWMTYYIPHRSMAAAHYVWTVVSLGARIEVGVGSLVPPSG
jgi:hypothetical protein